MKRFLGIILAFVVIGLVVWWPVSGLPTVVDLGEHGRVDVKEAGALVLGVLVAWANW